MHTLLRFFFFASASFFFFSASSRAFAATCSISSNTTIDAAYVESNGCDAIVLSGTPTIIWSGTIDAGRPVSVSVNSGTAVFSGALTLGNTASAVVVASGATVTHTAEDKTGVQIFAQTLTVSGDINANAKGCGTNKGINGSGDCAASNAGAPGNSYGGAGHGGVGGSGYYSSGGTTYGSSTNPALLGSGGGPGGVGGGRVGLTVDGTLTINGTVTANGGAVGGSGGSVYVSAAVLNGSGVVSANGGNGVGGCDGQGNGGGGRIAIYYDAGGFSVGDASSVTVTDGTSSCTNSRNGTTYILDRRVDDGGGNLVFNGGGLFYAGGDFIRNSITVTSGSDLKCDSALTSLTVSTTQPLNWSTVVWACAPTAATSFSLASNGDLTLSDMTATFAGSMGDAKIEGTALTTSNIVWSISGADTLAFNVSTFTNTVTSTFGMTKAGSYTTFNTNGPLTLNNFVYNGGVPATNALGGHLFFPSMTDLTFVNAKIYANVSNTLSIFSLDTNSLVSATGKGCQAGYGPNASNVCTSATAGAGSHYGGAGHGGVGGTGYVSGPGATYGSLTYPSLFGSGQGPTAGSNYAGGRILLAISGALTLNGSFSASASGLGGSGGSIYVSASSVAGSGSLAAVGGNGDEFRGPGGGGRIALIYSQMTYSGTSSTAQGTGTNNDAGVGTIYTFQSNVAPDMPTLLGQSSLVNGSTTSTATPTFSFTLSDPDVADTVKYQIQIDDSADFGSPIIGYTGALAVQGIQTFQVGQAAGSGSYVSGQDAATLSNGSYYWQVKAIDANAAVSSYVIARGGSIAFVIDTTPRYLSFESMTGSGLESVTVTSIRVLLDIAHFENVTTTYSIITASTTAEGAGTDYTLATGEAVITAGETSTTISLLIVNDQIDEPNETIGIELSSPIHAIIGSNTSTLYTILDNDTAGVTVAQVSGPLAVTEGGIADAFTMVLDSAPTSTIQISFSTSTLGLTLSTSTLTFTSSDWNVVQTVYATGTNDRVYEGTHTTSVQPLLATSAYSYGYEGLSMSSFTGTITDNDTAGVTITPTTASVTEGLTTDTYQVVLDSQPTSTIRITFATSTNGVTLDATYLDFTSSSWETPQSVLVTATDDLVAESTHTSPVSHTASVLAGYALGYSGSGPYISDVIATITDNDSAGVSISKASASVTEGGNADGYTVVLTTAPTSTVTITFTLSDDQTALSASTMTFTALNWSTPQTITVTAANDQGFEFTKTMTITHTASSDGVGYTSGLSIGSVTVTVLDNDDAGGGGAGAGAGMPVFIPLAQTPIPVEPIEPTEPIVNLVPQETKPVIETILNPSDVMSLVASTGKPRDTVAENTYASLIKEDIKALKVTASENDIANLANFVTYGISKDTVALGSGERKAVVKDAIQTMGTAKIHPADLERMTRGVIPQFRNRAIELQQLSRVRQTFTSIYGHDPNFKNTEENLAWNTLMYRIRFPRDLKAEKNGIKEFKATFGKDPKDPFQWATVRVMGYVNK